METLGDVQELENIACQRLGIDMALVAATAHRTSPASSVASSRCETDHVRSATRKPRSLSPAVSRQSKKIMEPFSDRGNDTSSDDDSDSDVASSSINPGRKRCRALRSRSTSKDSGLTEVDVRGSDDLGSDDSEDDVIIKRQCIAGKRRKRMRTHGGR
jgi:hypothetical protein